VSACHTLSLSLKRRSRHTHSSALPHLLQVRLPSQPLPPHPHPHHHLRSTTVPWAPPAHLADCHAELKRVEEWRRRMAATMAAMRMRTGATVCGVTSGAYDCVAATASEGRSRTRGTDGWDAVHESPQRKGNGVASTRSNAVVPGANAQRWRFTASRYPSLDPSHWRPSCTVAPPTVAHHTIQSKRTVVGSWVPMQQCVRAVVFRWLMERWRRSGAETIWWRVGHAGRSSPL
jgi:hypothetical protein